MRGAPAAAGVISGPQNLRVGLSGVSLLSASWVAGKLSAVGIQPKALVEEDDLQLFKPRGLQNTAARHHGIGTSTHGTDPKAEC
jgi:hypothetical protein